MYVVYSPLGYICIAYIYIYMYHACNMTCEVHITTSNLVCINRSDLGSLFLFNVAVNSFDFIMSNPSNTPVWRVTTVTTTYELVTGDSMPALPAAGEGATEHVHDEPPPPPPPGQPPRAREPIADTPPGLPMPSGLIAAAEGLPTCAAPCRGQYPAQTPMQAICGQSPAQIPMQAMYGQSPYHAETLMQAMYGQSLGQIPMPVMCGQSPCCVQIPTQAMCGQSHAQIPMQTMCGHPNISAGSTSLFSLGDLNIQMVPPRHWGFPEMFEKRQGEWYCLLCHKYSNDDHVRTDKHQYRGDLTNMPSYNQKIYDAIVYRLQTEGWQQATEVEAAAAGRNEGGQKGNGKGSDFIHQVPIGQPRAPSGMPPLSQARSPPPPPPPAIKPKRWQSPRQDVPVVAVNDQPGNSNNEVKVDPGSDDKDKAKAINSNNEVATAPAGIDDKDKAINSNEDVAVAAGSGGKGKPINPNDNVTVAPGNDDKGKPINSNDNVPVPVAAGIDDKDNAITSNEDVAVAAGSDGKAINSNNEVAAASASSSDDKDKINRHEDIRKTTPDSDDLWEHVYTQKHHDVLPSFQ